MTERIDSLFASSSNDKFIKKELIVTLKLLDQITREFFSQTKPTSKTKVWFKKIDEMLKDRLL